MQLIRFAKNTPAPVLPTISINGITGTWSPAVINTSIVRTTTYTFTPGSGQCANRVTKAITIYDRITPAFAVIGPLCQNNTPPPLPSNSTEGIIGTWSPATIVTTISGTTSYYFTPTAGQCAWVIQKDITINPRIIPLFTQIGPLCQFSPPPLLPETSTNGITGTWSPAKIITSDAGKTTYTFTPGADECASEMKMDITIKSSIIPTFAKIEPQCQHSDPPALSAVSTNGINGTWEPAIISTEKDGTFTYTFTPDPNGPCASVVKTDIMVTPQVTPVFDPIGPLCLNSTPSKLPLTSTNGINGTWAPSNISTDKEGTFNYIFTPDPGLCAKSTTLTITVNAPTIPDFTAIGPLCQNTIAPALALTSSNGIRGTWEPSAINTGKDGTFTFTFKPEEGQCAIPSNMNITVNPTTASATDTTICSTQLPYSWNSNSFNAAGTYHVKLVNAKGCDSIATLNLKVVTAVVPTFNPVGPLLQGADAPGLTQTSINGIKGTWDPATISTVTSGTSTYTFTPDPGQCATAATMKIEIDIQAVISADGVIPSATGVTIGACQQVNLDASKSIGDIVEYQWSLPDQGGTLTNQSGINTKFQLPAGYTGTLPSDFRVKLLVTDRNGITSSEILVIHIDPLPLHRFTPPEKLKRMEV